MADRERCLDDLVKDAVEGLSDWIKDNPGDDPDDTISELADSAVPVYTYDILNIAANSGSDGLWLATSTPELYSGDDSEVTAIKLISLNIYEHVSTELRNKADELVHELTPECDECGERTAQGKIVETDTDDLFLCPGCLAEYRAAGEEPI